MHFESRSCLAEKLCQVQLFFFADVNCQGQFLSFRTMSSYTVFPLCRKHHKKYTSYPKLDRSQWRELKYTPIPGTVRESDCNKKNYMYERSKHSVYFYHLFQNVTATLCLCQLHCYYGNKMPPLVSPENGWFILMKRELSYTSI